MKRALKQHVESLAQMGVTHVPRSKIKPRAKVSSQPAVHEPGEPRSADPENLMAEIVKEARACRACPLYKDATQAVVFDGTPRARLVFVGEAPGFEEDKQGVPFVGAAGQLLTKMIQAMGMQRSDVFICNVVKHRPPGNRTPEPDEAAACFPFLQRQLAIVQPKLICALGSVAAKALLGPGISIMKIRGSVQQYAGIPLVPTFHPAYLLRNPSAKKLAWADLQLVKRLIDQPSDSSG